MTTANPTVTSVSVSCMPTSITTAQTSTCTATVVGTGAYTTAVTWTTTNGTITSAGVLTPGGAGTSMVTANSTQSGYTNVSGSANVAVTVPITITSVSVTALPTTITTAQTSTCTAVVAGTGAFGTGVTWTATNGTITSAGVFTPTGAGAGSCTATSTQDSTKSGTAPITVTLAPPVATSLSLSTTYTDEPASINNIVLTGANFLSSDVVTATGCVISSAGLTSSTAITINLNCLGTHYTTGYIGFSVCHSAANGGTCSGTVYFAYLGESHKGLAQNGGVLYFLQGTTLNEYTESGSSLTATGSFSAGLELPVSADDTTGDIVVGDYAYNSTGTVVGYPNTTGISDDGTDYDAELGVGTVTRPSTNYLSYWNVNVKNATLGSVAVNCPISNARASWDGTTRSAYVVSRCGTPIVSLFNNESLASSVQLTGFSPVNTYPGGGTLGGWPIVVFKSGPAKGLVAVLSVPDAQLNIYDQGATKLLQSIKLSSTPVNIATDTTNGNVIVAYTTPATATTTFSAVNATTGATSTRSSTSTQFPIGFLVSADGTELYIAQQNGTTPDVQPNK